MYAAVGPSQEFSGRLPIVPNDGGGMKCYQRHRRTPLPTLPTEVEEPEGRGTSRLTR